MDQSFEHDFDALYAAAFRVARRILGDPVAAEDAAAEACARAYADWGRVGALSHRNAWVARVSANVAIDAARRRPRFGFLLPRPSVEDEVILRVALIEALRALPRRQRESVVLRHLAGLSETEVAQELGVSAGTVKTHVSRGLAALRASLGDSYQEAYSG